MNIGVKILIIIVISILIVVLIIAIVPSLLKPNASKTNNQVGETGNLFKSTDAGSTWQKLASFPGNEVREIVIDKNNSNAIMVGTEDLGLWRSNDGGNSWEGFRSVLGAPARIYDILEPAESTNFIALVYNQKRGRVVRFLSGEMQELLFTPIENFAFFKGYAGAAGLIRVIGSDGGLYETKNGGSSWRAVSRFKNGLVSFEINRNNPSEMWTATSKGTLFYSRDGGFSWQDISGGLATFPKSSDIKTIYYDPDSGALYHGSSYGLLVSYDKGLSFWEAGLTVPPEALPVTRVITSPKSSSKIMAGVNGIILISNDGGETWTSRKIPGNGNISSIAIDPKNTNNIYVGFEPASKI